MTHICVTRLQWFNFILVNDDLWHDVRFTISWVTSQQQLLATFAYQFFWLALIIYRLTSRRWIAALQYVIKFIIMEPGITSMAWCKIAVTPVRKQLSYCTLALTHRCVPLWEINMKALMTYISIFVYFLPYSAPRTLDNNQGHPGFIKALKAPPSWLYVGCTEQQKAKTRWLSHHPGPT